MFERIEPSVLVALLSARFEQSRACTVKVNRDSHVEVERHDDLVPYTLVGESVKVRVT